MINGCYPDQLKIAHVIPIYKKKGKKDECPSYRPISLLGNINRIFEKIIYKRLYNFFNKYNILNFNQYGFRKNHSTAMAIYDILESKLSNLDKNKVSCAIYLDLSKAFDTVDKTILLKKLEHFGIRGIGLKLLENYLTNRKQCVMLDGVLSEVLPINCGVPQGSNLGPLLFLIYVNDLPGVSNLITKLFADDTCLFLTADSVSELQFIANNELKRIEYWMASNKLTINYSKTKYMIIRSDKGVNIGNFNVIIDGNVIDRAVNFKYLGIQIDDDLSWKTHIQTLESEISRMSRFICKLRHYVDFECLKSFYYAKVYSKIQYAILAWGGCCDSKLHRLNILHNNIIRILTLKNMPPQIRLSTKTLYKSISMLQLKDIFHLELAKFMHKAANKNLPSNLNKMFTPITSIHRYPTSSSRKRVFVKPIANKALYSNWISSTGITIWESIDPKLKKLNYSAFKKSYRSHLLENY